MAGIGKGIFPARVQNKNLGPKGIGFDITSGRRYNAFSSGEAKVELPHSYLI